MHIFPSVFFILFALVDFVIGLKSRPVILGSPTISGPETDAEIMPPGSAQRPVSPVGSSLSKVLNEDILEHNFAMEKLSKRPDGLAGVGLLYIQDYTFKTIYSPPPVNRLQIDQASASTMYDELGEPMMTKVLLTLTPEVKKLWENHIEHRMTHYEISLTKRYGLEVSMQLRADLACPVTTHTRLGGLKTMHRALVVLASLQPFIGTAYRKVRTAGLPWMAANAQNLPQTFLMAKTEVETQIVALMSLWNEKVDREIMLNRNASFGPPGRRSSSLPMPDYEKSYLQFIPECTQSDVLNQVFTHAHCVILPVEVTRLFPEEKALLHCANLYPVGTQVYYMKVFKDPASNAPVRAVMWTSCKDKWLPPIALEEKEGNKKMNECGNRNRKSFKW